MHANNKVHVSNKPLFGGGGGLSSENEFENVFCEGCVCIFTVCFDVTKIICFFFCVFFFCDFCGNTNAVSVFFSTILACLFIIYLKMKISFIVHFLPTECSWSSL